MIYTKVAKVLNSTSVILAAGSNDGIKEGMEFVIYDLSETICDPETGEDLGQLELVKGRVYAVHVQDKLTWAQTRARTVDRVIDPMAEVVRNLGFLNPLFQKQTVKVTVHDELHVEGASPIEVDRVVRIGDKVRSVYQPELALTGSAD